METKPTTSRRSARILGTIVLFFFGFFLSAILTAGFTIWQRVEPFLQATNLSLQQAVELAQTVRRTPAPWKDGAVTFLLLGTDSMENRGGPVLTDTMLLASLKKDGPTLNLYSIPRDVWSDTYKTKINALYRYGAERYPNEPERFTREVLAELTGVTPQYTVVLDMTTVQELIDAVGGVEVVVLEGFTDPLFPREDVDVRVERDPKKLYKTVTFEPGAQRMDGLRAMEFIRSRHSTGAQGTDIARSARQQQILMALLKRLQDPSFLLSNPQLVGSLYRMYQDKFDRSLPLEEVGALGLDLRNTIQNLTLGQSASSVFPQDPKGVLEHPKNLAPYQNQWVYIIRNKNAFQQEVRSRLGL